ncbi:MAG: hypothetical protein MZV63_04010 [Marinilabiliales bacterium]|nr:hypothetical protein [Marinilabiliales bacterium]
MENADWRPFVKAAIERNPVCHEPLSGENSRQNYEVISKLKNTSIYEEGRLAQPDEVWNFSRGDGAEKAFLMANALLHNNPDAEIIIGLQDTDAVVSIDGISYHSCDIQGTPAAGNCKGRADTGLCDQWMTIWSYNPLLPLC